MGGRVLCFWIKSFAYWFQRSSKYDFEPSGPQNFGRFQFAVSNCKITAKAGMRFMSIRRHPQKRFLYLCAERHQGPKINEHLTT
jgi:hypothetical protein